VLDLILDSLGRSRDMLGTTLFRSLSNIRRDLRFDQKVEVLDCELLAPLLLGQYVFENCRACEKRKFDDQDQGAILHDISCSYVKISLLCEIFVVEWKMIAEISVNF
jgi:hypothetical protein